MPTFASIRDVPQIGLSEWEYALLAALKENVEVLMGTRQAGARAIMSDQITVVVQDNQQLKQVTAKGDGFDIGGQKVAGLADHVLLIQDVQGVANDVARLQNVVNTLLQQMKG
jgi:hypothetical protein